MHVFIGALPGQLLKASIVSFSVEGAIGRRPPGQMRVSRLETSSWEVKGSMREVQ